MATGFEAQRVRRRPLRISSLVLPRRAYMVSVRPPKPLPAHAPRPGDASDQATHTRIEIKSHLSEAQRVRIGKGLNTWKPKP
jgi:hypothetical protein